MSSITRLRARILSSSAGLMEIREITWGAVTKSLMMFRSCVLPGSAQNETSRLSTVRNTHPRAKQISPAALQPGHSLRGHQRHQQTPVQHYPARQKSATARTQSVKAISGIFATGATAGLAPGNCSSVLFLFRHRCVICCCTHSQVDNLRFVNPVGRRPCRPFPTYATFRPTLLPTFILFPLSFIRLF